MNTPRGIKLSIYLPEEQAHILTKLAELTGMPRSAIVRGALTLALQYRGEPIEGTIYPLTQKVTDKVKKTK